MACQCDFQLFNYFLTGERVGRRVVGLNENKAKSASQLKLELGLGKNNPKNSLHYVPLQCPRAAHPAEQTSSNTSDQTTASS
jgi:hypothetical protein